MRLCKEGEVQLCRDVVGYPPGQGGGYNIIFSFTSADGKGAESSRRSRASLLFLEGKPSQGRAVSASPACVTVIPGVTAGTWGGQVAEPIRIRLLPSLAAMWRARQGAVRLCVLLESVQVSCVLVSLVNSKQMSVVGLHPVSCKSGADAAQTVPSPDSFPFALFGFLSCVTEQTSMLAFPVSWATLFSFYHKRVWSSPKGDPEESGIHCNLEERRRKIFFLLSGSGLGLKLLGRKGAKGEGGK